MDCIGLDLSQTFVPISRIISDAYMSAKDVVQKRKIYLVQPKLLLPLVAHNSLLKKLIHPADRVT